ncbi:MAG: zinc-ribbon domain-containing protein [Anaerolineae bacterium]|jgi:hypothetical protein
MMSPESDPIALRWYRRAQIDEAARVVREDTEAGMLSQLDLALALSTFLFRGAEGSYWYHDAWMEAWYRFDGRDWMLAQGGPPQELEGLDGLAVPPEPISPPQDTDATMVAAVASPVQALVAAQAEVREAYRVGWIASTDAEALLGQSVLIDHDGRVWTVGANSGTWYCDDGTGWVQKPAPPDPDSLARIRPPAGPCPSCGAALEGSTTCPACGTAVPPELEGLSENAYINAVRALLSQVGALPEPLTAPWAPPAGYPNIELPRITRRAPLVAADRPVRCPACGTELRPGARFCGQCGTAIETAHGERS